MVNRRQIFFHLLLFLFTIRMGGQETDLFIPFVKDFPKTVYDAGLQNQDIVQDRNGVMYFANNGGMLVLYGSRWRSYPLANKTVVRSLALDSSGIIYAGGQNEFGYFAPSDIGDWEYRSLRDLVPENHRSFDDVWDAEVSGDGVFFRASGKIFHFSGGKFQVYDYDGAVTYLEKVQDEILIQISGSGLFVFRNGNFVKLPSLDSLGSKVVSSMIPIDRERTLVATRTHGLYIWEASSLTSWDNAPNEYFATNLIHSVAVLPDGDIALGTVLDGLVIVDTAGTVHQHLNRGHGLLSNTVHAMLVDQNHHLWLALEGGLNYLLIDSPFRIIQPDNGLEGIPYTAKIFEEKLYIGTSNGLYYANWPTDGRWSDLNHFHPVENSQGQIWSLQEIDGDLLIGHHEGDYVLEGDRAVRISDNRGLWLYQERKEHPGELIAGAYDGLHLYRKEAGRWRWRRRLPSPAISSRFLVQDGERTMWVTHPYKGAFRLRYNEELTEVEIAEMDEDDGLPSTVRNHVFRIGGELLICARELVYVFDRTSQKFRVHEEFTSFFQPDRKVRRLYESPDGSIWFITEDEVGVLEVNDKSLHKEIRKRVFPELKGKLIGGFEYIYLFGPRHVFLATEDGFILFDPDRQIMEDSSFSVFIDEVTAGGKTDSTLFRGLFFDGNEIGDRQVAGREPVLPHSFKGMQFSFSASDYAYPDLVDFRYYLEGFDEGWSEWTKKSEKEYSNLHPGHYAFRLEARNVDGSVSRESVYAFTIRPPWYASRLAYWIYGLLLFTAIALMLWLPQRKFRRERNRLTSEQERLIHEHRQAIERSEREKMKLKNEKLLIEIEHKNRELVSAALNVVEKKDILHNIAQDLTRIYRSCDDKTMKKKIGQVLNKLDHENQFDDDWKQFIYHFEQVHEEFFQRLREKHPNLTARDHKLCAYLRLNLSTKEIASILNITARSAEVSRYRLRKKLDLKSNDKLANYLMNL